jgi:hypothetical protein
VFDPNCRVDVALRTHRNLYVTALNAVTGWYLAGVSERVLGWENFTLLRLSDDEVALKTAHGTYVTAFSDADDWSLRGRADRILGWESFTIHYLNNNGKAFGGSDSRNHLSIALRTRHGQWVRGGGVEQGFRLAGNGTELQPDCIFGLRIL